MSGSFSGTVFQTIDPKGRITVPTAYRPMLADGFTIGMNNEFTALALYPIEKWNRISANLARIPDTDVRGQKYVRLILSTSFADCSLDAQGRVLLPAALRTKAGIMQSIAYVGMNTHLEIWDSDRFAIESEKTENDTDLIGYVNSTYFAMEVQSHA